MRAFLLFTLMVLLLSVSSSSAASVKGEDDWAALRSLVFRIKHQIRKQRLLYNTLDEFPTSQRAQNVAFDD